MLLPIISDILAKKYILFLGKTLQIIGTTIKDVLFFILFIVIIIPIGIIQSLKTNTSEFNYHLRNTGFTPSDFKKMWWNHGKIMIFQ